MGWEEETKIVPVSTNYIKVAIAILFALVIAIAVFLGVMYSKFTKNTVTLMLYSEIPHVAQDLVSLDFKTTSYRIEKNGIVHIKTRNITSTSMEVWLVPTGLPHEKEHKISDIKKVTSNTDIELKLLSKRSDDLFQIAFSGTETIDEGFGATNTIEFILYQYDI